jgi:hypothetical protein
LALNLRHLVAGDIFGGNNQHDFLRWVGRSCPAESPLGSERRLS